MMSRRTKQCKHLRNLFTFLHLTILFLPLIIAIPQGFIAAQGAGPKQIALTFSIISAVCVGLISVFIDAKYRGGYAKSILWLVLLGLAIALEEVKPLLISISILSIIDELIIIRLRESYRTKYLTNKEIDLRE